MIALRYIVGSYLLPPTILREMVIAALQYFILRELEILIHTLILDFWPILRTAGIQATSKKTFYVYIVYETHQHPVAERKNFYSLSDAPKRNTWGLLLILTS